MNHSLSVCFVLLASCLPALAQTGTPTKQSGNVTPSHAACWTTNGIIQDCGTAAVPFLTSIGTVGQGPTICANTAPQTSGAWQQICLGGTTAGGAEIYVQNFGTALAKPLTLMLNGSPYQFPFSSGGGGIIGANPSVVGDVPTWGNTIGTLLSDTGTININGAAVSINTIPVTSYAALNITGTDSDPSLTPNAAALVSLYGSSNATALVFGINTSSPFSAWIQARNWLGASGTELDLNPVGSFVTIAHSVGTLTASSGLAVGPNWAGTSTYSPPGASGIGSYAVNIFGESAGLQITSRTLNGAAALGVSSYSFADSSTVGNIAWDYYGECHRITSQGGCYGMEIAAVNRNSVVNPLNAANSPAGPLTFGHQIDCGNSEPSSDYVEYSCSVGISITKNADGSQTNLKGFGTGIAVRTGSLDSTVYNPPEAISLSGGTDNYAISWWSTGTNRAWYISSNATSGNNSIVLGNNLFSMTAPGAITVSGGATAATWSLINSTNSRTTTVGLLDGFNAGINNTAGDVYLEIGGTPIVAVASSGITLPTYGLGLLHSSAGGVITSSAVNLATGDVTGNLPVTNLNSGTNADSSHFWRGDGTWAAGTGAMTYLCTITASNSASLNNASPTSGSCPINNTYTSYLLVFHNIIPATNEKILELQIHSASGGAGYKATGYLTNQVYFINNGTTGAGSITTYIPLSYPADASGDALSSSAPGFSAWIQINNPSAAAICFINGQGGYLGGGGALGNEMISGYWNTAAAVDGFQVLMDSGNITSGSILVYGIT